MKATWTAMGTAERWRVIENVSEFQWSQIFSELWYGALEQWGTPWWVFISGIIRLLLAAVIGHYCWLSLVRVMAVHAFNPFEFEMELEQRRNLYPLVGGSSYMKRHKTQKMRVQEVSRSVTASETRIRFRGVRFQIPNSVSFSGLTEFRGANSVSSSQPIICV